MHCDCILTNDFTKTQKKKTLNNIELCFHFLFVWIPYLIFKEQMKSFNLLFFKSTVLLERGWNNRIC